MSLTLKILKNVLKINKKHLNQDNTLNQALLHKLAQECDNNLIDLLISNNETRNHFFYKKDNYQVFKRDIFIDYISHKNFLQNSYTKYKTKIGLHNGKEFLKQNNEVVLNFPFKDCILEGAQSKDDEKRVEIYFNEVLASQEIDRLLDEKVLSNAKRISKDKQEPLKDFVRDESINKKRALALNTITDNLIIKGNNLLCLHTIKSNFANKIKLIYIDPPYNTGNDSFNYNDRFNHSTWLTFMKNRLEIARELLSENGVIFVQCDDNEQAYLKVLMDEVFGKNNNEITFYVQVRFENKTLNEDNNYQKVMESIFAYSKNNFEPNKDVAPYKLDKFEFEIIELEEGRKEIIDNREVIIFKPHEYKINKIEPNINGLKSTWATGSLVNQGGSAAEFFYLNLKQRKQKDGLKVLYKVMNMGIRGDGLGYRYIIGPKQESAENGLFYTGVPLNMKTSSTEVKSEKTKPIPNYWDFKDAFGNCRTQGDVGFNSGKKPEQLLKRIIEIATQKGDIVLDFHLGSGTTCAVAHKMGRQYIGIEQMDYIENISVERLKKVINGEQGGISKSVNWSGGGEFVYFELKKLNQNLIEKIDNANNSKELLKLKNEIIKSNFIDYRLDSKEILSDEVEFLKLSLLEQKKILFSFLDKNQLYVNYSERDDIMFNCSRQEKEISNNFYGKK